MNIIPKPTPTLARVSHALGAHSKSLSACHRLVT